MAERSAFGTAVYGPDNSYINGLGNIADKFSPAAMAAARLQQAHQALYEAEARKAGLQADDEAARNAAYTDEALQRAGVSDPIARQFLLMTRTRNPYEAQHMLTLQKQTPYLVDEAQQKARLTGSQADEATNKANLSGLEYKTRLDPHLSDIFTPAEVYGIQGGFAAPVFSNSRAAATIAGRSADTATREEGKNTRQQNALDAKANAPGAGPKLSDVQRGQRILNQDPRLGGLTLDPAQSTAIAQELAANHGDYGAALQKFGIDPNNIQYEDVTQARPGVTGSISDFFHGGGKTVGKRFKGFMAPGGGVLAAPHPSTPADQFPAPQQGQSVIPKLDPSAPIDQAPAAPSQPAPATAPASPQAAPAAPAGDILPNKQGGLSIKGVDYNPGDQVAASMRHGQATHIIDKRTGQDTVAYWNANTGKYQTKPVFQGNEDLGDFKSMKGENNWLGVIPAKDASRAAGDVAKQALALGVITPEQLAAAQAADGGNAGNQVNPGYGPTVQKLLLDAQDKIVLAQRQKAMSDPRIAQYASGNFGTANSAGMPSDAMALAQQIGINRKQYGIPEAGPLGVEAFTPWGYGEARDAMQASLPAFFQAVRDGRFDPRTLTVTPAPAPQVPPLIARR
jgi:hypothetical protein